MSRTKRQEELKPLFSEDVWRTVPIPLNETMITLLSEHLRDVREVFDLSPEYRELAWLIDEQRAKVEKALLATPDIFRKRELGPAKDETKTEKATPKKSTAKATPKKSTAKSTPKKSTAKSTPKKSTAKATPKKSTANRRTPRKNLVDTKIFVEAGRQ